MKKILIILGILAIFGGAAYAFVEISVNGTSYSFPEDGDLDWGNTVTSWAQAISSYTLQNTGGSFVLGSEVNFGPVYGLKSLYFKGRSTSTASTGILRMANGDSITWRNATDTGDMGLLPYLETLKFNGNSLATVNTDQTFTNKKIDGLTNTLTNIKSSSLPNFDQDVRDSIGAILANSSSINMSYDSGIPSISASVSTGSLTDTYISGSASIGWTKIDKTGGSISDLQYHSHASLTDIGVNTHIDIDNHIGSTGNPHSVTKTQVGLGNVTNDAQVKKAASSTDNAIAAWSGTDGDALKDTLASVDTSGSINIPSGQSYKINNVALAPGDVGAEPANANIQAHISATIGIHGVTGSLAGISDSQVFTNKDYDGGTASDARRITLPKDSKANLDVLTRKEGTLVYGTDTQKVYYDDGATLVEAGSGSGGGLTLTFATHSTDYDMSAADSVLLMTNSMSVTVKLPSASDANGKVYWIKPAGSGPVTVQTNRTGLPYPVINGWRSTATIQGRTGSIRISSDGTNFWTL